MRKTLGRATAIAAGLATPLILAVPAHAADFGEPLTDRNGTWKAYGLFDDSQDLLCVRAFNSVRDARAQIEVFIAGSSIRIANVIDPGGDDNRTCTRIEGVGFEDARVDIRLTHIGSSGRGITKLFQNRVL